MTDLPSQSQTANRRQSRDSWSAYQPKQPIGGSLETADLPSPAQTANRRQSRDSWPAYLPNLCNTSPGYSKVYRTISVKLHKSPPSPNFVFLQYYSALHLRSAVDPEPGPQGGETCCGIRTRYSRLWIQIRNWT
jgi:hypothetical protein